MAKEQETAPKRRNLRWKKLFLEAQHDPKRTRVLEAMECVMEENREVLERLAKS